MSDAVNMAPLAHFGAAVLRDLAPVMIPLAVGWLAHEVRAFTGVTIDKDVQTKLDKTIEDEAGAFIAEGETAAALSAKVPVNSPEVAAIANRVLNALPNEAAALGLGPDQIALKVAGAIGRLQAKAAVSVTPAAAK